MAAFCCRSFVNRVRVGMGKPPILLPEEQDDRFVYAQDADAARKFCDNVVITSKYTWYNFLPVFLFEQFTRFANAYFLLVSILQTIPSISITNGVPTNFLPLSVVLGFDGIVTAREDYKRHKDDNKANSSKTLVMRNGRFTELEWRQVLVGDILKIRRNEAVPADCVFLSSYSQDAQTPDTCYVQTAQLDGETSLKLRQAIPATVQRFQSDADCASFTGFVQCEPPSASFERFIGTYNARRRNCPVDATSINGMSADMNGMTAVGIKAALELPSLQHHGECGSDVDRPHPLEAEQTLLRGSIIRNVDYVYGLVVYTGRECKVRVRQTSRVMKRAQVESEINRFSILLMALLLAFCITGTSVAVAWLRHHPNNGLGINKLTAADGVRQTLTYFLLNAAFIPVSLYVTVRLARSFQMWFMEKDNSMFHHEPELVRATNGLEGQYPFNVRTMDLNDELGQITHIFSDKTGTLTLNYMEFRKLMVNGVAYGLGTTQIGIDRMRREGLDVSHLEAELKAAELRGRSNLAHVNFDDGSDSHPGCTLTNDMSNPLDQNQGTAIHDFMLHLALNHTVLPEVVRDNAGRIIGSRLSASSPDEEAFLCAAESFGYKFTQRTPDSISIQCKFPVSMLPLRVMPESPIATMGTLPSSPSILSFRILHILAYSQDRKRMSVIVEHPMKTANGELVPGYGGEIVLYCKGADSVILPRLCPPSDAAEVARRKATKNTLAQWGSDGLRTLCFAQKKLSWEEFRAWSLEFTAACSDIDEIKRRKAKQQNRIESLMDAIEQNLVLQGATANEDKLQPEVPETIALLSKAGIKVWMVTGDKQETAVNIGFATRLLDTNMRQVVATVESAGDVRSGIQRIRIAAKRIHQEAVVDSKAVQDNRNVLENGMEWLWKQLDSLETSLGFAAPQNTHALPAATCVTKDNVTPASTPRMFMVRSRGSSNADKASPDGRSSRAGSMSGRNRVESFSSEEGETHMSELEKVTQAAPGSVGDPSARLGDTRSKETGFSSPSSDVQPLAGAVVQVNAFAAVMAQSQRAPAADSPRNRINAESIISNLTSPLLGSGRRPYALIVDEAVLDAALNHDRSRAYLLYVAVHCNAVICCRARPDQKARVVKLIREGVPASRTLAVGDGANDVDMIRQAHVGVGISGAEGMQAANASDYAIGRFRFLQRLLLVHGRWNYTRMSRLVLYTFYKNLLFVCAQYWYSFESGFSGQKYYIEYGNQTYNLIYTSLPLLMMGIFDSDIYSEYLLKYPQLYEHGRLNKGLNVRVFVAWFAAAMTESLIIFFFAKNANIHPDPSGATPYIFQLGTVVFSCVLAVATFRVAAEMNCHHWWFQILTAGSALVWIPACYLFDAMDNDSMLGGMRYVFGSVTFWLTLLLVLGTASIRTLAWKAFKRFYKPTLRHIVQEAQSITKDFSSIDAYTHAVDISRRTGRSVQEVLQAANLANTAAQAINMRMHKQGQSAVSPTSPGRVPVSTRPPGHVQAPSTHRGIHVRPGTQDITAVDTRILEQSLFRARPRVETESASGYDPAEDFDKETPDESATFAAGTGRRAGRESQGLYSEMQRSGIHVTQRRQHRFLSQGPTFARNLLAQVGQHAPHTTTASSASRWEPAWSGTRPLPSGPVVSPLRNSFTATDLEEAKSPKKLGSPVLSSMPPSFALPPSAASPRHHVVNPSRLGAAMSVDPLAADYVSAHYTVYGPATHPRISDLRSPSNGQPQR